MVRVIVMVLGVWFVGSLAACGGGDDPPSCQQAITHYYSSGCTFLSANTGQPTSQQEALAACFEINGAVPDECRGEFETFLECVHSTPEGASNADCDCTQESDALFACGS